MAYVTAHAAQRYVERIAPHLTADQAKQEIMRSAAAINRAAAFGASIIRLGNGARLCLEGDAVTTVKLQIARIPASARMLRRWHRASR